MSLFDGILLASFVDSILHRRRMADRRLRAIQRMLVDCGPAQTVPESPLPHRLLGEIARSPTVVRQRPARPSEFDRAMRRFQPSSRTNPEQRSRKA